MAITTHPDDPIGAIRLLIGDNVEGEGALPSERNFSDEEIQWFIDQSEGDIESAAALALDALARSWSKVPDTTVGPLKQNFSAIARAFSDRATALKQESGVGGSAFAVGFQRDDGYAEAAEDEE